MNRVRLDLSHADALLHRQALSRCAAERRIAAARTTDRELATVMAGQAAEFERCAAGLPEMSSGRPSLARIRALTQDASAQAKRGLALLRA